MSKAKDSTFKITAYIVAGVMILFWFVSSIQNKCIDASEAWSKIGEEACVRYYVAYPYQSDAGNVFLNEKRDYKNGFSTVIFNNSGLTYGAISKYGYKTIEVTGEIKEYQNHPEIIIEGIDQIKIL